MNNIVIILGRVLWILHYVILKLYGCRSCEYSGAQVWNKLSLDIKGILNIVSFSLKVKGWLLSRSIYLLFLFFLFYFIFFYYFGGQIDI